jgi:hypothetical protein
LVRIEVRHWRRQKFPLCINFKSVIDSKWNWNLVFRSWHHSRTDLYTKWSELTHRSNPFFGKATSSVLFSAWCRRNLYSSFNFLLCCVWRAQEEPENSGALSFVAHRIKEVLANVGNPSSFLDVDHSPLDSSSHGGQDQSSWDHKGE